MYHIYTSMVTGIAIGIIFGVVATLAIQYTLDNSEN